MSGPRNPLHTYDCPACGAHCGTGRTHMGKTIHFDLAAKVYSLVGGAPLQLVLTEMAAVDHEEVCPYKNV